YHAAALRHVARGHGGDVEVGGDDLADRASEVGEVHVEQGDALQVIVGSGVEGDIDAVGGGSDPFRVRTHGRPVQRVHDGGLHVAAGVPDLLRDRGQFLLG